MSSRVNGMPQNHALIVDSTVAMRRSVALTLHPGPAITGRDGRTTPSFPETGRAANSWFAAKVVRRAASPRLSACRRAGVAGCGWPKSWTNRCSEGPRAAQGAAAHFGRAKSCILLYLYGSPSQLETFDVKPQAPVEIRGELGFIQTPFPATMSASCCRLPSQSSTARRSSAR